MIEPLNVSELTGARKKVWRREQAYWKFSRKLDYDGVANLFSEDTMAWSARQVAPIGREQLRQDFKFLFGKFVPRTVRSALVPYRIEINGDYADVLYSGEVSCKQRCRATSAQVVKLKEQLARKRRRNPSLQIADPEVFEVIRPCRIRMRVYHLWRFNPHDKQWYIVSGTGSWEPIEITTDGQGLTDLLSKTLQEILVGNFYVSSIISSPQQ